MLLLYWLVEDFSKDGSHAPAVANESEKVGE
jgi:hypothetical protein